MKKKEFLDLLNTTVETTEEHYDEMLGCLPPRAWTNGAFLVGEPAAHRDCKISKGYVAVYDCFFQYKEKYYALGEMSLAVFNKFFKGELI